MEAGDKPRQCFEKWRFRLAACVRKLGSEADGAFVSLRQAWPYHRDEKVSAEFVSRHVTSLNCTCSKIIGVSKEPALCIVCMEQVHKKRYVCLLCR